MANPYIYARRASVKMHLTLCELAGGGVRRCSSPFKSVRDSSCVLIELICCKRITPSGPLAGEKCTPQQASKQRRIERSNQQQSLHIERERHLTCALRASHLLIRCAPGTKVLRKWTLVVKISLFKLIYNPNLNISLIRKSCFSTYHQSHFQK